MEELKAIEVFGRLHPGPNSCEGEHFATTVEHAKRWVDLLYGGRGVVIEIAIADEHFRKLYCAGLNVDNIGPAYFADESLLEYCQFVQEVHE